MALSGWSEAIVARASVHQGDLIVLGPHRPLAHADAWPSCTATRLIRTSPRPILIVRLPLSLLLRNGVAAVDRSAAAFTVLAHAARRAACLGSESATERTALRALHLIRRTLGPLRWRADLDSAREPARRAVARAAQRVKSVSHMSFTAEVRRRRFVGRRLPDEAADRDLIVIGAHGRVPLARAILGSVASGMMREAPSPVRVIPWFPSERDEPAHRWRIPARHPAETASA